jgi:ribosomal protein S18 acetylase RimI-like enzyme
MNSQERQSELQIITPTDDHVRELADFQRELWREARIARGDCDASSLKLEFASEYERVVAARINRPDLMHRAVVLGSEIVAYLYAAPKRPYPQNDAYLHSVDVLAGYRNGGIGSILVQDIESRLDPRLPISLDVPVTNLGAQRFFSIRHGYQIFGGSIGKMVKYNRGVVE